MGRRRGRNRDRQEAGRVIPGLGCQRRRPRPTVPLPAPPELQRAGAEHISVQTCLKLHVGKNAAKLWDAGNLTLKRHNYRVRLTERQQSAQTGAKTRLRVRRQSYIYACECQLTKHKPDGPKGVQTETAALFRTPRPSNICRNRTTGKNKHFLPLPRPTGPLLVQSRKQSRPTKCAGTNIRTLIGHDGGVIKGRCCLSPSQTSKH